MAAQNDYGIDLFNERLSLHLVSLKKDVNLAIFDMDLVGTYTIVLLVVFWDLWEVIWRKWSVLEVRNLEICHPYL